MVAIVSGAGLGLQGTSTGAIGASGQLGSASLGRAAQGVTVNAANGNLIIQTQDEFLTGRGPDAAFVSSYNSLGAFGGNYTNLDLSPDADGWLLSTQRKIELVGTANTAGSAAKMTDWDGSIVTFTYNTLSGRYEADEQPYNDDILTWSGDVFTYTEGKSWIVQTFASNIGGRLVSMYDAGRNQYDQPVNLVTFTYDTNTTSGKLTRVTTANSSAGQNGYVDYGYDGSGRLQTLATYFFDGAANQTISRVTYGYDTDNRLISVVTDLKLLNSNQPPATYRIDYTYKPYVANDPSSKLITGITQSDGTSLTIDYDGSGRVTKLTQAMDAGITQTTEFTYGPDPSDATKTLTVISINSTTLNYVYKMTADASGRLTRLEEPAPVAGGDATIKTFAYDAYGNVTEALTFDSQASVSNPGLAIEAVRSLYDAASNLLARVNGDRSISFYTYRASNQLLSVTRFADQNPFTSGDFDSDGFVTQAEYDAFLGGTYPASGAMVTRYIYDDSANNGINDDGSTYPGSNPVDVAENHLRFTVSAEGRVTEYRYDDYGQLIATINYGGGAYTGTSWTEAALGTWVAGADKSHAQRVDTAYDFRGNVSTATSYSKTDAAGNGSLVDDWSRLTYDYDQTGRLISRRTSGYNSQGGEPPLATETFVYDGLGRMISATDLYGVTATITIIDSTRTTIIETPGEATRTQGFMIGGGLETEAVSAAGTTTATTNYSYDALGRLRKATDPSGLSTYYTYDRQNRLTATIDADGSISEIRYDAADRVIATVRYATAVSAANLTALGNVTVNTEIAAIRPTASASDRWSWTIYDKSGKVIETIDAAGAVVKFDYDGAERLIGTTRFYNTIAATTVNGADGVSGYRTAPPSALVLPAAETANDRVARNFYDNDGLLAGTLDEEGYLVEIRYDKAGRKVETVGYSAVTSSALWASGTFAQLRASIAASQAYDIHNFWVYDGRGRVMAAIDGEGQVTRYRYTARGDLDQEVRGNKLTAAELGAITTEPHAASALPLLANLDAKLMAGQVLETTTFTRNAAGQVLTQVRALSGGSETTTFTYDTRGRLLTQTVTDVLGANTVTRTDSFRYDARGRLIGQLSGVGSAALAALGASPSQAAIDGIYANYGTRYVYDIADRLVQTINPNGIDGTGVSTFYYYDSDGQLRFAITEDKYWDTSLTTPAWVTKGGAITEYRYNVLEDRTDMVVYQAWLPAGTLASLTGGLVGSAITTPVAAIANPAADSRSQWAYDVRGLVSQTTDANGWITTNSYNAFGQLTLATTALTTSPASSVSRQILYTRRGQVLTDYLIGDWADPTSIVRSVFSYDAFGNTKVRLDSFTNFKTTTYGYDRANRMVWATDPIGNAEYWTYDSRSNAITRTDRAGNTANMSYDLFSRTVTTTSAEGVSTSVQKNAWGQAISLTDGRGIVTRFEYDKDGNLTKTTEDFGTGFNAITGANYLNQITTQAFDQADRLIEVTGANGAKIQYKYDALGRVLTEVRDAGAGRLNLTTRYEYDAKGQGTKVTDASGMVTTYAFNRGGQVLTVVQDSGAGKLNLTTTYEYARADGKVTKQTEAVGTAQARVTAYAYDSYGRLTQKIEDQGGLGLTTQYFYDINNNLVAQKDAVGTAQMRETRFIYDKKNRLVLTIDAEGRLIQNFYDAEDRLVATRQFVNALGSTQIGNLASLTAPAQWNEITVAGNGDVTLWKKVRDYANHDSATNVTSTNVATITVTATDRKTRTLYDKDSRATFAIDGEGYATRNVLDAGGNVLQSIRYAAKPTVDDSSTAASLTAWLGTSPQIAASTSYVYDALNRVTRVTDPENVITLIAYQAQGQYTDTIRASGTADAVTTRTTYDALGRTIDEIRAYGTSEAVTTRYAYDALGQVTDATVAYGTSDAVTTRRTFDALGRVLSEVRDFGGLNATTQFTYDALGRLVKTIDPRGNASFAYYDNLDRTTWQVDAEGYVTRFEYLTGAGTKVTRYLNAASNAASVSPTVLPVVTADANGRDRVTFSYTDKLDRVVWQVDGEGNAVKTEYGFGGEISKVTRFANPVSSFVTLTLTSTPTVTIDAVKDASSTFLYDRNGRVIQSTDAELKSEYYSYDALGQRISFTNKLGGVTSYSYFKTGLLKTETAQDQKSYDANGTALLDGGAVATSLVTSYTYDLRGNLKAKVVAANLGANALTTSYGYDKLDRLISQTDPAFFNPDLPGTTLTPVTTWEYDRRGNVRLQTAPDLGKTFTYYDALNRKKAEVSPVGTLSEWAYDANGNLTNQKIWATAVAIPGSTSVAQPTQTGTVRETRLSYDKVGRLTQSLVMNVRTGAFNGSAYVTSAAQNLQSNNEYDGLGNLVKEIDANRNAILHWYDRNGREVAKLDQEQYLTTWVRDADGNVTSETRFASKYTGAVTAAAPSVSADALNDRTTTFTYDRMGRRLTEVRKAMLVATVTGNTVATASQDVTVAYAYNALGEVLSKTEATGDKTDYQYDLQGRLIRQLDAVQADYNASGTASVRHVSYFKYDGANNLVVATERAEAGTAVSTAAITPDAMGALASGYALGDDRTTKYLYTGGKLTGMTDAMGFTRSYTYDVAGRKTGEYYTRTRSDATTVTEGQFTGYDLAGRATSQWQATRSGTTWTALWPQTLLTYNTYGEVTARAIKASAADTTPLTQEQMVYDNAGRVVKTNAGDGVWKVMVYDANGNATLSLSAISADMSAATYTIDTALAAFGAIDTSANQTMAATISLYDKRNMASATREPMRAIDATATRYTITRARTYTAFGEVASETDARGNTTNYLYNTMGTAVRSIAPTVSITNEDGSTQWVRPTSDYYYDKSGRLVGTRDANGTYAAGGTSTAGTIKAANSGNLTTRQLLAGTGYGGSEAKVLKEFRPDVSVWESRYDAFGQQRLSLDGLQRATTNSFDKAGRITQVTRPSGYSDFYAYDQLGQRIQRWNSLYIVLYGAATIEKTDYDSMGRVVASRSYAGDLTTTSYALHTLANSGMGLSGGWTKTTTDAGGRSISENSDYFGRMLSRADMRGLSTSTTYNRGGQLTLTSAPSGGSVSYTYFNTGQLASSVDTAGTGLNQITATFAYDKDGNRTGEKHAGTVYSFDILATTFSTQVLQDATTTFDTMGRVVSYTNKNAAGTVDVAIDNVYDANGNVRRTTSTYPNLAYPQYGSMTATKWFRYDSLNRMVMADGGQTVSANVTETYGEMVTYNQAGERATQTKGNTGFTGQAWVWVWYPESDPANGAPPEFPGEGINGEYQYVDVTYTGARREKYSYNVDGQLTTMESATTGYVDNGNGTLTATQVFGAYELRASTTRDASGRITNYKEYLESSNGVAVSHDRSTTYDVYDRTTLESSYQLRGGGTVAAQTTNVYAAGGGPLISSTVKNWLGGNDSQAPDTLMTYGIEWADGSRVISTTYDNDTGSSYNALFTSANGYDGLGRLSKATIQDGRPRTVSFANTVDGKVLLRKERSSASANPEDRRYFLAGVQMGELTNNGNGDPDRVDWNQSILQHTWTPNSTSTPFRWNQVSGYTGAQMGADGYDPLNASGQGMSGTDGRYMVRSGDTLAGIAQAMWGDASLWYVLAQANGLSSDGNLVAGQSLVVPDKVVSNTNNASTYRPYDAAHATGDLSPTTAKPPKRPGCGIMLLLAVVAIAVSVIVTAGAASAISGQAFGAVLGAMTGGAGVSVGVGTWVVAGAIGGAVGSIASQAVGVAVGAQDKINWKGVALAGIAGGIGGVFQGLGNAAKLAQEAAALKAGLTSVAQLTPQAAQAAVKASLGSVGGFLASSGTINSMVRAVITSGLTQGIGKLTGLQDKISWGGIAGAALSGGLAAELKLPSISGNASASNIIMNLAGSMAGNIVNAAARSVIDGGDFGDNIMAALPDTLAQTMMDLVFRGVVKGSSTPFVPTDWADEVDDVRRELAVKLEARTRYAGQDRAALAGNEVTGSNDIVVTGSHSLGGFGLNPGWRKLDGGLWINQAAIDKAMADLPQNQYASAVNQHFFDTVNKLQAEDRAARHADDIVVTGQRRSGGRKSGPVRKQQAAGSSKAAGGIASHDYDSTVGFTPFFNEVGGAPGLPTYLRANNYIGSPEGNLAFVNQIKDRDGVWQIDRVILPSLAMHLDDPDVKTVHDELRNYVDDINARANAQTNKWVGQMVLAAWGAPAAAAGAAAAAPGAGTFLLVNAGRITTGGVLGGEIVTGVSVSTPIATAGVGAVGLRLADEIGDFAVAGRAAERGAVGGGPRLLPGEGNVGTYRDLIKAGSPGDNLTPNHIPSANRMALEDISKGDGIAINMQQLVPGVGGRHRATFTYGTQADIGMTPRDALAAGVWDARNIYRADGLYTPQIRSSLQELILLNKTNHPTIFVKPTR